MRKILMSFVALAAIAAAATGPVRAQSNSEELFYTLDGTQVGDGNAYNESSNITQGGISWWVTGNTSMNPWRIGGKSLNAVDRDIYGQGSLDETITKVSFDFGALVGITVNSITMFVASDANFSDIIEQKTVSYSANSAVDVTPGAGIEWTNAYYMFTFNVTVSGSSNKYFQLKSIKFYYDPNASGGGSTPEPEPEPAVPHTVRFADGNNGWQVQDVTAATSAVAPAILENVIAGDSLVATYSGTQKVKSVKAVKYVPSAVLVDGITLNKTATTITAGQTETLSVSSVTPDDATDQTVTWSSDNEAVATVNATTGEVTANAFGTANITATANDGSGVTATCVVTVNKVVTINQSDWGDGYSGSFTKDGVTVSAGFIHCQDGNLMEGGTFSTTLGNFTKIVVTTFRCYASGTGWSGSGSSMTWAGTPASTVSFSGDFMGEGETQTTIVCTIEPAN